jgi:iron complex transport system permease protein
MKRAIIIFSILLLALLCSAAVSLLAGSAAITPAQLLNALLHPHTGDTVTTIVWHIRLTRTAMAIITGIGLAGCGCVFQGILRNPLADPYTLGVSGGAAFGATLAIASGIAAAGMFFLPAAAFAGALFCVSLVYAAASRRSFSQSSLILGGVVLGFVFSSMVLLIIALADAQKVQSTVLWLMGDLATANGTMVALTGVCVLAGIAALSFFASDLNILTLGEEKAMHLGLEPAKLKKILFAVASLVTGAVVAATGIIGFVGLIIPHAVRRFTGPDHRVLLPASALAGAAFLLICDTIARTIIAPTELPVGVITGLTGGIFFLGYLMTSRNRVF